MNFVPIRSETVVNTSLSTIYLLLLDYRNKLEYTQQITAEEIHHSCFKGEKKSHLASIEKQITKPSYFLLQANSYIMSNAILKLSISLSETKRERKK